jgi:hypothetical protein
VVAEHGVSVASICLLPPRSIVKTTSGKIARALCKRHYLEDKLVILYRWDGNTIDNVPNDTVSGHTNNRDDEVYGDRVDKAESKSATIAAQATDDQESKPLMEVERRVLPRLSPEELRALSVDDIRVRLEEALVLVASGGHSQLSSPINADVPVSELGLDSMTLVQYKGVLEKR